MPPTIGARSNRGTRRSRRRRAMRQPSSWRSCCSAPRRPRRRPLERLRPHDTWASFAAMTDPATGLPADSPQRRRHAPACRRRRRTSAPTCGAPSSPSGSGIIRQRRARRPAVEDDRHARADGAPRRRPVLQLVRPPHGREADGVAADRRAADADPLVGRQRLARGRAEDRRERACRSCHARAGALYDAMDFGFYYRPEVNRILFHYAPGHRRRRPAATTRSSARAGSPTTSASPRASCRRRSTTAAGARSRTPVTGLAGDQAGRRHPDLLRRRRVRGRLSVRRHAVTPSWGGCMFEALMPALFVPEEKLGAASWGVNHPLTVRAQIHHGLVEARLRLLGLLAVEHARGRLRRLRRRRDRHGPERQPLQRGQHARRPRLRGLPGPRPSPTRRRPRTPTASSRRTPSFLALRYAPARGAGEPRAARARLPGHVRPVGLPRQRQRRHAASSPAPTCRSTRA